MFAISVIFDSLDISLRVCIGFLLERNFFRFNAICADFEDASSNAVFILRCLISLTVFIKRSVSLRVVLFLGCFWEFLNALKISFALCDLLLRNSLITLLRLFSDNPFKNSIASESLNPFSTALPTIYLRNSLLETLSAPSLVEGLLEIPGAGPIALDTPALIFAVDAANSFIESSPSLPALLAISEVLGRPSPLAIATSASARIPGVLSTVVVSCAFTVGLAIQLVSAWPNLASDWT